MPLTFKKREQNKIINRIYINLIIYYNFIFEFEKQQISNLFIFLFKKKIVFFMIIIICIKQTNSKNKIHQEQNIIFFISN